MPRKPLQRRDIRGCRFRPSLDFIWCVHFPHSSITFLLCGVYVAASDSSAIFRQRRPSRLTSRMLRLRGIKHTLHRLLQKAMFAGRFRDIRWALDKRTILWRSELDH